MKKYFKKLAFLVPALLPLAALADALPAGNPITFSFIDDLSSLVLSFLIEVSGALMVCFIVVSGIMIMASRDNPQKFGKALQMLKTAIIGSGVILAAGVILSTVMAIVDRSFFCSVSVVGVCLIP